MKIEIRDIKTKELLKSKRLDTNQHFDEYWEDYRISNNFLINNTWYTILRKEKNDKLGIFYVEEGRRL